CYRRLTGEGRFADLPQDGNRKKVVILQAPGPMWKLLDQRAPNAAPAIKLNPVPLAIIEADRLYCAKALERPGDGGRRVLATRKKDESGARLLHARTAARLRWAERFTNPTK